MTSTDLWIELMSEMRKSTDELMETMLGGFGIEDSHKKHRSKELAVLSKKEPNLIKVEPYNNNVKDVMYHSKVPKEKIQKYFNRHTREETKNDL